MKKNNTFIFGESGFVGTHLKILLNGKKDINIIKAKKPSKHIKSLDNFYFKYWNKIVNQSDTIIYLSFNNDLEDLKKNISNSFLQSLIPLYILCETIKKNKKKIKLVYLSTASLYGNKVELPVREISPIEINNIYEYLKHLSEQILINSNNKYLNYQILRLSNVYGENISEKKQNNRQVLNRVILDALFKKKIKVFGTGNYFRDFIHVKDVCDAIFKITTNNHIRNEIFNIGTGKKYRLIDVFNKIKGLISLKYGYSIKIKKIKLEKISSDRSDIRNFQASISKSKKKFGMKTTITLENGLNNLITHVYKK